MGQQKITITVDCPKKDLYKVNELHDTVIDLIGSDAVVTTHVVDVKNSGYSQTTHTTGDDTDA